MPKNAPTLIMSDVTPPMIFSSPRIFGSARSAAGLRSAATLGRACALRVPAQGSLLRGQCGVAGGRRRLAASAA